MKEYVCWMRIAVLGILTVLCGVLYLPENSSAVFGQRASLGGVFSQGTCEAGTLCVFFLDVGQGDAVLIESPDGTQLLIDGGSGGSVLRELGSVLGFFDRDIDMVLATHPDQDHIGGLVDVLERYQVDTILRTENESDTPVANRFSALVAAEGAAVVSVRAGERYDLGSGPAGSTTLTILFPDRDPSGFESNTASIVAELKYGSIEFLFTGDAPQAIEEYLVELYGSGLESEVLKVGHHGSKTSTAKSFLSTVNPDYAVISAGKDNRYGHPHKEVVGLLSTQEAEVLQTATDGTVRVTTDGRAVSIEYD